MECVSLGDPGELRKHLFEETLRVRRLPVMDGRTQSLVLKDEPLREFEPGRRVPDLGERLLQVVASGQRRWVVLLFATDVPFETMVPNVGKRWDLHQSLGNVERPAGHDPSHVERTLDQHERIPRGRFDGRLVGPFRHEADGPIDIREEPGRALSKHPQRAVRDLVQVRRRGR